MHSRRRISALLAGTLLAGSLLARALVGERLRPAGASGDGALQYRHQAGS
jgi:hypothetical protein